MLTKEQLWNLRKQIEFGSLFIDDYENDMGIDKHDCYEFFDGYIDYHKTMAREMDLYNTEYDYKRKKAYKTPDDLYDWYMGFTKDPLPTEFIECQWCHELFDPCQGKHEANMGFLCNRCIDSLWSRGEKLYLEV